MYISNLIIVIIKRLLNALQIEVFVETLIPVALQLLDTLFRKSFAGDTIRLLCTFLVATLPKGFDPLIL